jgi:hypothetical protein
MGDWGCVAAYYSLESRAALTCLPSITIHQTGTSAYYKFEIVHDRKEEKNFAAS